MATRVTIARAGSTLRRSYTQVLRLLMIGELRGQQDVDGRWWVDADDVERFRREHPEHDSPAAA